MPERLAKDVHQDTSLKAPIIEGKDLVAGYGVNTVLRGLTFSIQKGEFVAVAGPNGAGKSTLLRVVAGLIKPTHGRLLLAGQFLDSYPLQTLAQLIGVIFQDFSCPYDFTVFDMVSFGRSPHLPSWKALSKKDIEIITSTMEQTNVNHLRDRSFFELSGGERQRVLIAKALAQKPSILLLDEPSSHLDIHHQVSIFDILHRLNKEEQVTILCITHDLTLAAQYIDRLFLLKGGCLLADGSPTTIIEENTIRDLFQTSVCVGRMPSFESPFIYPLRVK